MARVDNSSTVIVTEGEDVCKDIYGTVLNVLSFNPGSSALHALAVSLLRHTSFK